MGKIPFNQNDHLAKDAPGVCNSLVLEWLFNRGKFLEKRKRLFKRAGEVHERGVKFATFTDYGLDLDKSAAQPFAVRNADGAETAVNYITQLAHPMFLIGISGSKGEHAIGVIKNNNMGIGFDPNNGYYTMKTSKELHLWIKGKILGGFVKHGYDEVLVYPVSQHTGLKLPTQ